MSEHEFDCVIIGGGPGGYATALYGASAGLNVALVERDKVGGTCLHRGCIPAKELLETAAVRRAIRHAPEFGLDVGEPAVDWSKTVDRKDKVIGTMFSGLQSLLKGRKVTVVDGSGRLEPDGSVVAVTGDGERRLTAPAVVIATGSVPRVIPGFEPDGSSIVTSDEFLSLRSIPRRAAVIGGGAIGCEFASTLADMGTEVTILEGLPKILPGCDSDAADAVVRAFKKRKIAIRTGVTAGSHRSTDTGTVIDLSDGTTLEVDLVVVSVGRRPVTDGLGLDAAGVAVDERGFVVVDDRCRTALEGVWAVGDVIATPQLAHVAFAEGMLVVKDLLGESPTPIDHSRVPWAIYCHPEVAFAGHTEQSAIDAGFEVVTAKHRFMANGRAQILGDTDGVVKIIAERRADGTAGRILGVHMVGPWVTEQLGQGYLAVNWEATVEEVAEFIQPHPSLSELFGETVLSLTGRSLH